jgi:DNA-binding protein YbaB
LFTNVSLKSGKHCQHLHENMDQAQKCLLELQTEYRKKGRVSNFVTIEVDALEEAEDLEIL